MDCDELQRRKQRHQPSAARQRRRNGKATEAQWKGNGSAMEKGRASLPHLHGVVHQDGHVRVEPSDVVVQLQGLALLRAHTTRGGQGHLMLGERIVPQSEVIRAVLLEDSPCCGVPHLALRRRVRSHVRDPPHGGAVPSGDRLGALRLLSLDVFAECRRRAVRADVHVLQALDALDRDGELRSTTTPR